MASSVIFLGMSRGGSSITFQILQNILLSLGFKHHDPEGDAYRSGSGKSYADSPELLKPIMDELGNTNILVGPFRNNTPGRVSFLLENIVSKSPDAKIVIVTRDPVDCLYSWYFARNLHPGWRNENVKGDPTPSEFTIQLASSYYKEVIGLVDASASPCATHYSYHDIAFNPTAWLGDLIGNIGINPDPKILSQVNSRMAFLSPYENKFAHRRSGIPGASRDLLDVSTVSQLDIIYNSFNTHFGYPRQAPSSEFLGFASEISSLRDSLALLMNHNANLIKQMNKLKSQISK